MSNIPTLTPPEATFWVDAALTTLNSGKPLPLTVSFFPTSLNDRPDLDCSSMRGQVTIETREARQEAIQELEALKNSAPAPAAAIV